MSSRPRGPPVTDWPTDSESEGDYEYSPSQGDARPQPRSAIPKAAALRGSRGAPPTSTRPIRLNVASKPSGLRNQVLSREDSEEPSPTPEAPASRTSLSRSSKNQRKVIVDADTEESEEDEEDEGEEDEDQENDEDMDEDESEEEQEDAEGDEDVEMSEATPQPTPQPTRARATIKLNSSAARKPSPQRVLKLAPKVVSVEEKEVQMTGTEDDDQEDEDDDDDNSLSDANDDSEDSGGQNEEDDDDEELSDQPADLDALEAAPATPGEDERLDSDSDDEGEDGSRDPGKQTRRQRADNGALMALSNEAQKKKFFTQEQVVMRRTEMARRRKDLSEKRNEQEKLDTLDRLLHKRAPVRRTRAQMMADAEREEFGTPGREDGDGGGADGEAAVRPARPGYVRTVAGLDGSRVGVPEQWLGRPVGRVFEGARPRDDTLSAVGGSRMVQVVE